MKKIILIASILFHLPYIANADMLITEIMYDVPGTDSGREWIEIYNDSESAVTLKDIRVVENAINHTVNHSSITSVPAKNYVIVADNPEKFLMDNAGFSGTVLDSAFSLSNEGETLSIKVGDITSGVVAYVSTLGAVGDGNSLQLINDIWTAKKPTPAVANDSSSEVIEAVATTTKTTTGTTSTTTSTSSSSSSSTNSSGSTHSSPSPLTTVPEINIKTDAGRDRLALTHTPILFIARSMSDGKSVTNAKYTWSFGDGSEAQGEDVRHAYHFAGEYNVILNTKVGGKLAVSRTKVRVLDPTVEITSTDSTYIEIKNNGGSEINIGEWRLKSTESDFEFPIDTIIAPKNVLRLPYEITRVSATGTISLLYPNRKVASTYSYIPMFTQIEEQIALLKEEITKLEQSNILLPEEQYSLVAPSEMPQATSTIVIPIATTTPIIQALQGTTTHVQTDTRKGIISHIVQFAKSLVTIH